MVEPLASFWGLLLRLLGRQMGAVGSSKGYGTHAQRLREVRGGGGAVRGSVMLQQVERVSPQI